MLDLTLTGTQTLLSILALMCCVYLLIISLKYILKRRTEFLIQSNKDADKNQQAFKNRKKYFEVNVFRLTGTFLRTGLLGALTFCLFAFSWTTYEENIYIPIQGWDFDDIEMTPPRTIDPPLVLPPPPVQVEKIEIEDIVDHEPEFLDESIDEEFEFEKVESDESSTEPEVINLPPPPIEQELEVEEIILFAEQMPRFPGCENEPGDNKSKELCAKQKMLNYIYKNIKYPSIARENGVEGTVVIQFVVSKEGLITDIKTLRDVGAGCGDEAFKVVEAMNHLPIRWTPGKQRGREVMVRYTLPIKFKLQN